MGPVVLQPRSHVQLFAIPWIAACPASLSYLPRFAQTHVHWVSDAIQSHPLLFFFPYHPQFFPASGSFPMSPLCTRWPKHWSFSFSISPSSEYSGLISFRIDWFDLLAVQGTLKSLLQHDNLKALVLQCSAFFMVQHSHLYTMAGKTLTLNIKMFVCKVMSLLF